jgi:predicted kinase
MTQGPMLHLVVGLPGAGKTTLAAALDRRTGAVWLSPDRWMRALACDGYDEQARSRVEALQWQLALQILVAGASVILDNGFWSRAEREGCQRQAGEVGADTTLYYCEAPIDTLMARVESRNAALGATSFAIHVADIARWAELFQPPAPSEQPIRQPEIDAIIASGRK